MLSAKPGPAFILVSPWENPYPRDTLSVSSDGPGATASVHIAPGPVTFADFNERIMKPASEKATEACRNDMIDAMIAQLQAFRNAVPDEKQRKHLAKASKQLRKMGWPKTAIDGETWRKLHQGVDLAPNEMTLREAGERYDDYLAKGHTP